MTLAVQMQEPIERKNTEFLSILILCYYFDTSPSVGATGHNEPWPLLPLISICSDPVTFVSNL